MTRFILPTIVALAAASSTQALAVNKNTNEHTAMSRRGLFGAFGSAGVAFASAAAFGTILTASPELANAASAKTGSASVFTGDYDDPNHPGCLRQVKVVGAKMRGDGTRSRFPVVEVKGYDGEGSGMCTDRPATYENLWSVEGKLMNDKEALIDFSSKGGPSNLLGKYEDGGIVFPDGNKWTKVVTGTPNRRPVDMSTLKSQY